MKYTALTIGPIIETLDMARRTREIWSASYLFSFIMQKIIEKLKEKGIENRDFIMPYPDIDISQGNSAGVFPDRLIIKSQNGVYNILQNVIEEVINELIKNYNIKVSPDFLRNYLRTNIVETELGNDEKIIIKMNEYLAITELRSKYIKKIDDNDLQFLTAISQSKLYKSVFKRKKVPSLIQIATVGLGLPGDFFEKQDENDKDGEDFETKLWEKVKNYAKKKIEEGDKSWGNKLKTAHKYIAIVQSDGDNIGDFIKKIYDFDKDKNKNKIREFSKSLSEFSLEAVGLIEEWGAFPVYAGGDDLLFFSPVIGKKSRQEQEQEKENVFTLIQKLDEIFEETIIRNDKLKDIIQKLDKKPSMSYGVSITYYKYPLNEALSTARNLLFNRAKIGQKNAIAYRVLKHSGQYFDDVLFKDNTFYKQLLEMLRQKDINLISSIIYNLGLHKVILKSIIGDKRIIDDKRKIDNYFENYYNKDFHKQNEDFINKVKELLITAYNENKLINPEEKFNRTIQKVFSALRLIKFMNRKEKDND